MKKKPLIILLLLLILAAVWLIRERLLKTEAEPTFFVFSTPGTYGPAGGEEEYFGDVEVAAGGIHLQNLKVTGNLYLAPEREGGEITLSNLQVEGDLVIIALQETTVRLQDVTATKLAVSRSEGKAMIVTQGSTALPLAKISGRAVVTAENLNGAGIAEFRLEDNAALELRELTTAVTVGGNDTELTLTSGTINKLMVERGLTGSRITVAEAAVVELLELFAEAEVAGEGKIQEAIIHVPDVHLALEPEKLTAPSPLQPGTDEENQPETEEGTPVIISYIQNPKLTPGETVTVPVRTIPDEGVILDVSSTNSRVVTAAVSENAIRLVAVAPGTARILLWADHPEYAKASTVFSVTVEQLQTAKPTANPGSGEVAVGTKIILSCSTADAAIYYTLDGSKPSANSTRYNSSKPPVVPAGGMTLKTIAIKKGEQPSAVVTFTYKTPKEEEPEVPPDEPPPETEEPPEEPPDEGEPDSEQAADT